MANTQTTIKALRILAEDLKSMGSKRSGSRISAAADTIEQLTEQLAKANERVAELESPRKRNLELIKALFYAPSSPVTPNKAKEIEDWFIKVEQLRKEQE